MFIITLTVSDYIMFSAYENVSVYGLTHNVFDLGTVI